MQTGLGLLLGLSMAELDSFTRQLWFTLSRTIFEPLRTLRLDYKNLGQTGLKISAVGLGCGNFGGIGSAPAFFGKGETEPQAFALMDAAWEMGINFFDTADAYGGGRSETYIGNWLKTKGTRVKDQLILSSKVFNPVGDGPNDWG